MAVRTNFVAGEVLTAEDLDDTFASKVDYALPVNAQTGTTYTFVLADAEKLTTASNAAAVTLTIPPQSSVTWADNTVLRVVNYGAGAVTVDGGSGVTVTNTATTVAQYGAAVAIRTGSDAWTLVPFGGGDVPAAEVSSPAATGQYSSGGFTYDYYTFTSSGTLTVDTAGFADVLVVGGGASGGAQQGGGGGAGGHHYITDCYLSATTHTVTVGAGGAGVSRGAENAARDGNDGFASRVSEYVSPGGGGGGGGTRAFSGGTVYGGPGHNGGSGGGASGYSAGSSAAAGSGLSGLGNDGAQNVSGGGGGGAGGAGSGTTGGAGSSNSITGSAVTRSAGGDGNQTSPTSGSANTGDAGDAAITSQTSGSGGSGIVIVRVKV